jgi:hypothetical protein
MIAQVNSGAAITIQKSIRRVDPIAYKGSHSELNPPLLFCVMVVDVIVFSFPGTMYFTVGWSVIGIKGD